MTLLDRVLLARADEQTRGSRLPPDGRDGWDIGRARRPSGPKNAALRKLSDAQVRRLRRLHAEGEGTRSLAKRLGLSRAAVKAICQGKTYREVA